MAECDDEFSKIGGIHHLVLVDGDCPRLLGAGKTVQLVSLIQGIVAFLLANLVDLHDYFVFEVEVDNFVVVACSHNLLPLLIEAQPPEFATEMAVHDLLHFIVLYLYDCSIPQPQNYLVLEHIYGSCILL